MTMHCRSETVSEKGLWAKYKLLLGWTLCQGCSSQFSSQHPSHQYQPTFCCCDKSEAGCCIK